MTRLYDMIRIIIMHVDLEKNGQVMFCFLHTKVCVLFFFVIVLLFLFLAVDRNYFMAMRPGLRCFRKTVIFGDMRVLIEHMIMIYNYWTKE